MPAQVRIYGNTPHLCVRVAGPGHLAPVAVGVHQRRLDHVLGLVMIGSEPVGESETRLTAPRNLLLELR